MHVLLVMYVPFMFWISFSKNQNSVLGSGNDSLILYLFFICLVLGTVLPFHFIGKIHGISRKSFWRGIKYSYKDYFKDISLFLSIMFIVISINSMILNRFHISDQALLPIGVTSKYVATEGILFYFLYLVATPLLEQWAYQGVFLKFLSRYDRRFGLLMVAFFYAFAHGSIAEFVPAFFLSLILGYVTLHYRSIYPAIIMHISLNLYFILMALLPANLGIISIILVFALFIGAIYILVKGAYWKLKLSDRGNLKTLCSLFFLTPSILVALILLVLQTIILNIFEFYI